MTSVAHDIAPTADALFQEEVNQIPELAPSELEGLFDALAAGGAVALTARQRLVEGLQPQVLRMARRFARRCVRLSALDLAQEATLGLLQALPQAKPQATADAFFAWATAWIRGQMIAAYWRHEMPMAIPIRHMKHLRTVVGEGMRDDELPRPPRDSWSPQRCLDVHSTSLHMIVDAEDRVQGLQVLQLADDVKDHSAASDLYDALAQLPKMERLVVTLRYGLGNHVAHSQRHLAQRLQISRSQVNDIEQRAVAHLRRALSHPTDDVA